MSKLEAHTAVVQALVVNTVAKIAPPIFARLAEEHKPAEVPPPRGIQAARVNAEGHLVVEYTDGEIQDLGRVVGADGQSLRGIPGERGPRGQRGRPGRGIVDLSVVDGNLHGVLEATDEDQIPEHVVLGSVLGPPGPAGPPGEPGADGKPGADGANGLPGASVSEAAIDTQGKLVLGLTNGDILKVGQVVGPKGDQGPQGDQGPPGEPAPYIQRAWVEDGVLKLLTSDDVTRETGNVVGPPGPQGKAGPQGEPGPQGELGPVGPRGAAGEPGKNGKDGKDGRGVLSAHVDDGKLYMTLDDNRTLEVGEVVGRQGPRGEAGKRGARGATGAQGYGLRFMGAYQEGDVYHCAEDMDGPALLQTPLVRHKGHVWAAMKTTTSEPGTTDAWEMFL